MNKSNHIKFLEKLISKNSYYKNGDFTLNSEYVKANNKIKVTTKYGTSYVTPNALLSGKNPCGIHSSDNKDLYLHNWLLETNKSYKESFFKLISSYKGFHKSIEIETIYGRCSLTPASLISGSKPGIDSAKDKTDYWIKFAKDKNNKSKNYTFNKTILKNTTDKIIITCKKHGDFKIKPSNFTFKKQGCPKCLDRKEISRYNGWSLENWVKRSIESGKDFFYFYIIKCSSKEEKFYKVGITINTIKERFKNLPYNYEIISLRKADDGLKIKKLEKYYLRENNKNIYRPKIYFGGSVTECFNKIYDPLQNILYD